MTAVTLQTRVRVCRQVKLQNATTGGSEYSTPVFLLITTVENLPELLRLRAGSSGKYPALARVKSELEATGVVSLFTNDGTGRCHVITRDYDTNR